MFSRGPSGSSRRALLVDVEGIRTIYLFNLSLSLSAHPLHVFSVLSRRIACAFVAFDSYRGEPTNERDL